MKNILLISSILLSGLMSSYAQSGNKLFDPSVVHEINFTFSATGFWDSLLVNYGDSSSFSGSDIKWEMAETVEIDGTLLDSVGLRLRGKSSFRHSSEFKKPFKVDLNEFVKGQDYDGMKKFNLHNGACDPSQLRDFIAYDVMRTAGVKAPRAAHARVSINGQYWGLYTIIEQIDKTFVSNNFSNGSGNLFKNNAWSRLEWLGTDITAYQEDIELKTNETAADWSDYLELVDVLNNSPDSTFAREIQKVFDVENYLRVLATDIALNNWDSYVENQRNWYIYHNPETDLFEWIPWDYNLSMGGDFEFDANPYRPLTPGCDLIAEFQYFEQAGAIQFLDKSEPTAQEWSWDFGNGQTSNAPNPIVIFDDLPEANVCLTIKKLEGTTICEHTRCRTITIDFKVANCAFDSGTVSPYPITDPIFQIIAREDDFCCSESWDGVCEMQYQDILNGVDKIGELSITYDRNLPLFISDSTKVLIIRLLEVPEFKERFLELTCVLMASNFTKSRITNLIQQQTDLIRPYIEEEPNAFFSKDYYEYDVGNGTGGGNDVNIPALQFFLDQRIPQLFEHLVNAGESCETAFSNINWQDITINEFVASNIDSIGGQADVDGEFDDWVELYNNTNNEVDLTGYFLTDNFDQRLKWTFSPNTTIGARDYLIVWADKDEEQTGIHAGFKLEKNGEQLMLSHEDGTIIDSLTFGAQASNLAMARIPNGTGEFIQQNTSFNEKNELVSAIDEVSFNANFSVFPNPADQQITINFGTLNIDQNIQVSLRDMLGRTLIYYPFYSPTLLMLPTYNYPDGVYYLEVHLAGQHFSKKIIIQKK